MDFDNFPLAPDIAKLLSESGIKKQFTKGDVVLKEHAYIRSIPIVKSGNVKVVRTDDDGREILLYYITPGESCIMSFLGGLHNDTSKVKAIAEEDSEICFIPIEKVAVLIKENSAWLDYIFRLYHKRFEELLEIVNAVTFKKVDERLLNLLEMKSVVSHSKVIHTTHEELANELGTARVVVSRLLKILEHDGKVKLGRNKITLV